MSGLIPFIRESNFIENIKRKPTTGEINAHKAFLALERVTVADMETFVTDVAAVPLRRALGQDVIVGRHRPPPGGPEIEHYLEDILRHVNVPTLTPYDAHCEYETLHPFLDGNGRSGRVLWAWMMDREGQDPFALSFLHRWYYQSLDAAR
jgi:hypothetical protein